MASAAQIAANRRNALLSTGPRSAEGKAASRFNALKTGIEARSVVIPGEDSAELEQLTNDYHAQFQPAGPAERFLVDSMVNADWQLRRYRKVEAQLWQRMLSSEPGLAPAWESAHPILTRLHRRIDAAERVYRHALRQLQRLQAEGPDQQEDEFLSELASFSTVPTEPAIPAAPAFAVASREPNLALRL